MFRQILTLMRQLLMIAIACVLVDYGIGSLSPGDSGDPIKDHILTCEVCEGETFSIANCDELTELNERIHGATNQAIRDSLRVISK